MKSLKIFTIYEICPADHFKNREKNRDYKGSSSLSAILSFLPISFFFYQQALGRAQNKFNGPATRRKFHQRKHDKSCSKDLYQKILWSLLKWLEMFWVRTKATETEMNLYFWTNLSTLSTLSTNFAQLSWISFKYPLIDHWPIPFSS